MAERMIRSRDLEIWTESFGDPSDPSILLIQGPAPGLMWPDELCEDLAEGGRHVIRYDHRSIGRSTIVDFATRPYTMSDMAADAIGVLDAYGVRAGHLVGFSGGGAVAQTAAIEHPDRVASLTSWGATALGTASFMAAEKLPGFDPKVTDAFARMLRSLSAPEGERVEVFVEMGRAFSGTLEPFDEEEIRKRAKRAVAQTHDWAAMMNWQLAAASAEDRTAALSKIDLPTLVIHGTVDPAVPLPHGALTAKSVPGARLLTIEGMGHDFPRIARPRIVAAILEHTQPAPREDRIKLGVVLPSNEDPKRLVELARYAEELGFDSVWVPDGFADGRPAVFTMMSAIAVSTTRIEVGAYMLNASVYDPALLARAASTLERLAPGRTRTILGTGWDRKDYEALGQEFPPPVVRAERTRAALEMLKRETDVSVEVAGVLDDVLNLAATWADGWALSSDALDAYFERAAFLRRACDQNGRTFDELRVSCTLPSLDGAEERIADLAVHDMGEFRIVLNGQSDRARHEELVRIVGKGAAYAGRAG